jgi:hypothetical protein
MKQELITSGVINIVIRVLILTLTLVISIIIIGGNDDGNG